ncbi:MAG: nickel-dependent hydrogenase large subunit [Dethiobacteria bacterium]
MTKYTLPVGPQHPALKEPASFWFKVEGEVVADVDIRLGYNHRGIEKACESRNYIQCLYLLERICGICSHSHTTAFAQGVEEILGLEIPDRAKYIRVIIAELERIHSHLLWLGVAGHEIGFDTLFMYSWRDRETVLDILELISGNRINYAMNTIGGVRRDIDEAKQEQILGILDLLAERVKFYTELVTSEPTCLARLENVAPVPTARALALGTVGPTARASGVKHDVRKDDPYAAYAEIPFEVISSERGDLLGRAIVRLGEIGESVKIIRYALQNLPEGPLKVRAPRKVAAGEAVSRYEAPRGEDIHYIRSDGSDHPERVKVRAPTLANLFAVGESMKGAYVADIPIVIASIDPCFSCTDRMIEIAQSHTGESRLMTWEELREYGIRWYGHGHRS